ncbi:cytochrome P450 [Desarmillaria tabescens]|uniref:Cytochrome P450 n=1 Tax=Armillaria tabescens TaxID=1929756 RepID=A0AA39NQ45_ARMTA|nr:cytochrome P450 [Desarmillaria tabescens]KAK0469478.1 cytochrome P450 [Desarmillaria tabescens]
MYMVPLSLPFPPGPKGLPFIGNLCDIPAEYPWITYAQWTATYGDVLYLNTPGNPTIILNSAQVATELLEKRSALYSDRPDMQMLRLSGWDFALSIMRYSDRWRVHRRMFHQYFQARTLPSFYPVQMKATFVLLRQLLDSEDGVSHHIRHYAGSIIMKTVYDYDVEPDEDRFVQLADQGVISAHISGTEGTFLVDYFPVLKVLPKWFPGARFKNLAPSMIEEPFRYVSESPVSDDSVPRRLILIPYSNLEKVKQNGADVEVIKNVAAMAFAVSTILSVILAILLYPEVQVKAQAELDAIVGQSRLPHFDDRHKLPYINATLSEALRWNPVFPLGLAHRSVKDDVYKGYYIPGGATVIANVWAILHDEKDYPNPLVFDPERFIKREGKKLPPDPTAAFGFGRRICAGRYFASNTSWIAIASILSTLSISKAVGDNGRIVEPINTFTSDFLSHPLPFKCVFKARSAQAHALIVSEVGSADIRDDAIGISTVA